MNCIRKYWHLLAGIIAVAALSIFYLLQGGTQPTIHTPERTAIEIAPSNTYIAPPEQQEDIVIHIAGAVYQPGVFTLPYGSRVNDALNMAGGATDCADLARVNLAAFLKDAQQIIIPRETDEFEIFQAPAQSDSGGLVNINTADERLLTTLPGIGPVIAGNIISHREANGPFNTIEELGNVPRIGATTLNNLRDLITVN